MVAEAPTRVYLRTRIGDRMTPRGEGSIHQQVTPLILEEDLSKGNLETGFRGTQERREEGWKEDIFILR